MLSAGHLPTAYLAKSGPAICFFTSKILNNDQHQHQKTKSTHNRINSKIKQQHTTFRQQRSFDSESVFVVYKFVSHGKQFLPNRQGE